MNEKWNKLYINKNFISCGKANFAKIYDNELGLRIELIFENNAKVQFIFDTAVLSYNVCDEGRRMRTIDFLIKHYGDNFIEDSYIYTIDHSKYLEWFNKESYNILSNYNIKHYVFITSNDIIDVLSTYTPQIINDDGRLTDVLH